MSSFAGMSVFHVRTIEKIKIADTLSFVAIAEV